MDFGVFTMPLLKNKVVYLDDMGGLIAWQTLAETSNYRDFIKETNSIDFIFGYIIGRYSSHRSGYEQWLSNE